MANQFEILILAVMITMTTMTNMTTITTMTTKTTMPTMTTMSNMTYMTTMTTMPTMTPMTTMTTITNMTTMTTMTNMTTMNTTTTIVMSVITEVSGTWWFMWGVIGIVVILVMCISAYLRGSNPCYAGLVAFSCVYPCVCAACVAPCYILMCVTDKKSCDLCGKEIRMIEDDCDCLLGTHRYACLYENQDEFDRIPPSPLYSCKTCGNPLKLWPVAKLPLAVCRGCGEEYENDGTNVHVCFICQSNTYTKKHLCSKHHGLQTGEMREVNFSDKYSLRDLPTTEPSDPLLSVDIAPPSASGWSYIRQHSSPSTIMDLASGDLRYAGGRIKRMVSRDNPPPPTYEEATADLEEGDNTSSIKMCQM